MEKRNMYILLIIALVLGGCSRGIDEYVRQSRHVDVDVRVYGVEKLGESGELHAAPHLIQALKDEKARVRLAAIDALRMLKDKRGDWGTHSLFAGQAGCSGIGGDRCAGSDWGFDCGECIGRCCASRGACIAIGGDRCVGSDWGFDCGRCSVFADAK